MPDVEAPKKPDVEELHRLYSQIVYRYTYRRILDIESARQITNDVFRIAWQKAIPVGPDAMPWLLVTAKKLVSNEIRALGREQRLARKATAQYFVEQRGNSSDLGEQVQSIMATLRAKDREVLMLAYWDGLSTAEIAVVLGCSLESTKSRLFRARKTFERKAPASMLKGGSN
ncbi:RNA polymerase sigma factor [Paeniglutamicibacter sp. R2-26]|uniref:RNA polymerase sigma factor n=1 Tax=Paeniglutamicibacter sp. R2-26 TaxID=3144417 RepID=UPI003EE43DBA